MLFLMNKNAPVLFQRSFLFPENVLDLKLINFQIERNLLNGLLYELKRSIKEKLVTTLRKQSPGIRFYNAVAFEKLA